MKKLIVPFIAILYFTVSSGVVVNLHYCMGKLSSIKIDVLAKNLCGCKTKKSGGCCKTTHKLLKIEDSHKFSVNDYSFHTPVIVPMVHSIASQDFLQSIETKKITYPNAPPEFHRQDIYLHNCVFLI
jgi:hypothetical protein